MMLLRVFVAAPTSFAAERVRDQYVDALSVAVAVRAMPVRAYPKFRDCHELCFELGADQDQSAMFAKVGSLVGNGGLSKRDHEVIWPQGSPFQIDGTIWAHLEIL